MSESVSRTVVRSARRRTQSLRTSVSFALLAALAVVASVLPGAAIIGLTSVMIGALVFMVRRGRPGGTFDAFEIIVPAGVLYIVYFGGGAVYLTYSQEQVIAISLRPYILPALALGTVGFVALLCGYYMIGTRTPPSPLGRLTEIHPFVSVLAGTAGSVGMAAHAVQVRFITSGGGISPGVSALQQLGPFFFFGWFLVWYEWSSGRGRGLGWTTAFAVLFVEAGGVLYVSLGTKSLAIMILLIPCLAVYQARGRLPFKSMIVVGLVSIFVVFPFFNTFRIQSKQSETSVRLAATWQHAASWDSDAYLDSSVFAFAKRMAVISAVAAVVADAGTAVPYANGDTLILAPMTLLIPRFVWPEKPNISFSHEFGQKFRLIRAMDYETEIAPSLVGEFYWNFGIPCVLVGMFLFGAGYRWYYEKYGRGTAYDPTRKAIYATLLLTALGIESSVAMVIGGFVKMLVLLILFVAVMRHFGWIAPARSDATAS